MYLCGCKLPFLRGCTPKKAGKPPVYDLQSRFFNFFTRFFNFFRFFFNFRRYFAYFFVVFPLLSVRNVVNWVKKCRYLPKIVNR